MDQPMQDAPADVLVEARRTLEALKSSGLSREVLLEMWEAGDAASSQPSPDPVLEDASTRGTSSSLSPTSTSMTSLPPRVMHSSFGHRPRISVSSTSSGSSGHASIWSMASMNSNASVATQYSQAPLPSPPAQVPHHPIPQHPSAAVAGNPLSHVTNAQPGWGPGRFNFYWCTSCETRFKRKYDWKRHEEEFHERWKKYPCPEPGCNRSFWGANTFNQHHKSSHGCKTCPHSEKVVKFLKRRKYWACGFCSALHPSRERHVEHVARHFESGKTKADWMHSRVIYGLLHQPLIHEAWKDLQARKASEFAGRQPNFSWDPTQTGRAQGFMENECPGQLQDLLEFFSGSSADAESIVSLAYELADLVFLNVPASPPMDYAQCYPPGGMMVPAQPQQQPQQPQRQQQQQPPPQPPPPPRQQQQQQQQQSQQPQLPQHQQQIQPPPQPEPQPQSYAASHLLPAPEIHAQSLSAQQQPSPSLPTQQEGSHHQFVGQMNPLKHQQQQQQQQPINHLAPQHQHPLMAAPIFHAPSLLPLRGGAEPIPRSSLDRELPPPPPQEVPMNFNYMPNHDVLFEDWQSFGSTVVDEQGPSPTPLSAEWPALHMQYYHHAPTGQ
ncbi:hypothetical protein ACRALDRAFT_2040539 [Sodiomyces alcalophilus JCM 7366]|uniref:uncharacterized protein n=1 Tax=Sodiomyces alcalophilus JCM 7366 TaxID=591952 RepID=UPI0039B5B9F7